MADHDIVLHAQLKIESFCKKKNNGTLKQYIKPSFMKENIDPNSWEVEVKSH